MENLYQSIQKIQKLLFEAGIPSIVIGGIAVAAWGESRLNDPYILDWLRQFELALDDSTLVDEYQRLRNES